MPAPMSSQRLDPNLIRQLEEAYYGQTDSVQPPAIDLASMQSAPAPMPSSPQVRQMPTQSDLNLKNQEGNAPQSPVSLTEQLAQAYAKQQGLQSEAIKSAEEQLAAARSQPQQMDLSPLIALAESWSGKPSRLLQTYQRPQDQVKTVQALQEAVLKARGGASELARMRAKDVAQLEEQQQARQQRLEEIALKRKEFGLAKEDRALERATKQKLEVGKEYNKEYGEGISGLTEVVDAAKRARDLIQQSGGRIPTEIGKFDEYKRAVSQIITGYNRDVAKLGALAGADKKLLEAAASQDPNRLEAYIMNALGTSRGQTTVLDSLINSADKKMKEHEQLVKLRFQGLADPIFQQQKSIYNQARGIQTEQKKYTAEELMKIKQEDPEKFNQIKSSLGLK